MAWNRTAIATRLSRVSAPALAIGAAAGALLVVLVAPRFKHLFSVPGGGVGLVTVSQYPKGWDYAVIVALFAVPAITALLFALIVSTSQRVGARPAPPPVVAARSRKLTLIGAPVVFLLMLAAHDHPYAFMDMFHEGEHLAPAFVLRDGGHPYRDIFFLHGFAVDGGLDALVLGNPPSPLRARRLETILIALTLAMLVPVAAELTLTTAGAIAAVLAGLCAIGAGLVPVFPWFRLAPLLGAAWGLLVHVRRRNRASLLGATLAATLGVLWSLEVGLYTLAGTAAVLAGLCLIARRDFVRTTVRYGAIALGAPIAVLLLSRADLVQFARDSFITIPSAIDATWSLPARPLPTLATFASLRSAWEWAASEPARYYLPPVFFAFVGVLAIREAARHHRATALRMSIVVALSFFAYRTAAGRCSWSHTRFAIPLLGIAFVAFVIEPAVLSVIESRRWRVVLLVLLLVPAWRYLEVTENAVSGWKLARTWRSRQAPPPGEVPIPLPAARDVYTYPQEAADLGALATFSSIVPPGPMLDLSGERALYYLLGRRPAVRCPDVAMLSAPALSDEALRQLDRHPPQFVILEGLPVLGTLDGVPNLQRVQPITLWVEANYPSRLRVGRYVIAQPR